jgi:hypothetical protein
MWESLDDAMAILNDFRQKERAARTNLADFYPQGNGYSAMEGLKNQIISFEHLPHPDFLDKGILSATFLATMNEDSHTKTEPVDNIIKLLLKIL